MDTEKRNLLICFTGSVATIKDKELTDVFLETKRYNVKLLYTEMAAHFSKILPELKGKAYKEAEVIRDSQEYEWKNIGDRVLHIDLKNWVDVILIAPLSANTLAKIVNGICDNTVCLIMRAMNFTENKLNKPVFVAPAMNTDMWNHPLTDTQLTVLRAWGVKIIAPIEKILACKEKEIGAMEKPDKICEIVSDI